MNMVNLKLLIFRNHSDSCSRDLFPIVTSNNQPKKKKKFELKTDYEPKKMRITHFA